MRAVFDWLGRPLNLAAVAFSAAPFVLLLIFMDAHAANFPRGDDFVRSMPVAIATAEGALGPADLLTPMIGQVTVFSHLVTMVLTLTTGWDVILASYITVALAVAGFGLLVWLIARTHPGIAPAVVVMVSVLYFSLHQNNNWYISLHSAWFFPQVFFLGAVLLLYLRPVGVWPLLGALVLAVLAVYSHGNGMLAFPALAVLLWGVGYRRWVGYALWVLVGAASVYGYIQLSGVAVSAAAAAGQTMIEVNVFAPGQSIRFAVVMLGSMFVSHEIMPAFRVGVLALVLLAVNLLYLWRGRGDGRAAAVWLTLALYTLGTVALVGLTRYNTYPEGIGAALASRYLTPTVFLWTAVIVSGAVVVADASAKGGWLRLLAAGNILSAAFLAVLFGPSVVISLNQPYYDEQKDITEDCYMRALYIQDSVPLFAEGCKLIMGVHLVNELSLYELTMFADTPRVNLLGDRYTPGTPVVVEGVNGWANYHVNKWLLDGVAADDLLNIAPEPPVSDYPYREPTVPNPLWNPDHETVLAALDGADAFWLVGRADAETVVPGVWATLEAADYVPTRFTYSTPEDVDFTVTRYQRLELVTDTPIAFGDNIQMAGYTSLDGRLAACGTVTVRSFWETTDGGLIDGYSATMTLDRITGPGVWDFETVARVDSQLSLAPTGAWEPGELYLDERRLDVPCELPPGDYALRLGVYDYRDEVRLNPMGEGVDVNLELNLAEIERVAVE
jgi:hypothetical protein